MFLRFAWLQTFVEEMPAGSGKEAWRALAEKYQVPLLRSKHSDSTVERASIPDLSCEADQRTRDVQKISVD